MVEKVSKQVEEFAERLDRRLEEAHSSVFEDGKGHSTALHLMRDYKNIATSRVQELREKHGLEERSHMRREWARKALRSKSNGDYDEDPEQFAEQTGFEDIEPWLEETNTWSLFEELSRARYSGGHRSAFRGTQLRNIPSNDRFAADAEVWQDFLADNNTVRERFVMLKWLESTADQTGNDVENIQEELNTSHERGLWTHGWMDTREKIKADKRLRLWDTSLGESRLPSIQSSGKSDLLITHLDPDAVTRLHRALESPDQQYEESFWTVCWEMLRRGCSMDSLRDWCQDHNESARAYMLGAMPETGSKKVLSNSTIARYRWRKACKDVSCRGGLSNHERAVLGLLSGDFASVRRVCLSWEDQLFAYCNAFLLNQYQSFVHHLHPTMLPPDELFRFGEPEQDDSSFNDLAISPLLRSSTLSHLGVTSPFKIIQAKIIAHELDDFVIQQGILLARNAPNERSEDLGCFLLTEASQLPLQEIGSVTDDQYALRVLAHAYIILTILGSHFGSKKQMHAAQNVLIAYIHYLKCAGKFQLIPRYTFFLPSETGTATQAKILPAITDTRGREQQCNLMDEMGLDVVSVLVRYSQFALESSPVVQDGLRAFAGLSLLEKPLDVDKTLQNTWPGARIRKKSPQKVEDEEQAIINGLEWFLIPGKAFAQTFRELTRVMKRFLCKYTERCKSFGSH